MTPTAAESKKKRLVKKNLKDTYVEWKGDLCSNLNETQTMQTIEAAQLIPMFSAVLQQNLQYRIFQS